MAADESDNLTWSSAASVADIVARELGKKPYQAHATIISWAAAGLLKARGVRVLRRADKGERKELDDAAILPRFWDGFRKGGGDSDWAAGTFSRTWFDEENPRGAELEALGVHFCDEDLQKRLADAGSTASTVPAPKTGLTGTIDVDAALAHMDPAIREAFEKTPSNIAPRDRLNMARRRVERARRDAAKRAAQKAAVEGAHAAPAREKPEPAPVKDPVPQNPRGAGKPAFTFWDDAILHVTRRWMIVGDFKPERQADVQRAIEDWLDSNGHDAGPTAIKERARKLWNALKD